MDDRKRNKKFFYVFVVCITMSLTIIGFTFAYFTASSHDDNTIRGNASSANLSLSVVKVTDIDNAFGLIPMKNNQAPNAAPMRCKDDHGNAGCQIYKITVSTDLDNVMFLDGFIQITPKEGIDTRFTSVILEEEEEEEVFHTKFTLDDFVNDSVLSDAFLNKNYNSDYLIRDGSCEKSDSFSYQRDTSSDCLFVTNQQIGGNAGMERVFYAMVWVYDNGEEQNDIMGLYTAYQGSVVFVSSLGNEISASFD